MSRFVKCPAWYKCPTGYKRQGGFVLPGKDGNMHNKYYVNCWEQPSRRSVKVPKGGVAV